MIGLRFDIGPFGLPGFCKAVIMPCIISFGILPVIAVLLNISAISLNMISGQFFSNSAFIPSLPSHLLFCRVLTAILISFDVN